MSRATTKLETYTREARILANEIILEGELTIPYGARGVVLFAHGSGSGRYSPRNQYIAYELRMAGLGTLLIDLLTRKEEAVDLVTNHLRFDIGLLARRLTSAAEWLMEQPETANLKLGLFGGSTGGSAVLTCAARLGDLVSALVVRAGRTDLVSRALPLITAPTLLIVGEKDDYVLNLNKAALAHLTCQSELKIVKGASHLFGEPGALDDVANLSAAWFSEHM